jgi:DNA-binding transcriptional LysR family regulator
VLSGKAIANGAEDILNFGKSAYTDPFLVSTLLSVHLPLFPGLKVKVWSNFSNELAQQVIAGTLDLAVITGVPDTSKLHLDTIADDPFYIAMAMEDELAAHREIDLEQMQNRNWILLGQHANPYLYDLIQVVASNKGVHFSEIHPFTSPDEASELIREYQGLAFLPQTAAWRIARDGITMRPLAEDRLRLVMKLAIRSNNKSRLVNEFIHAAGRKLKSVGQAAQGRLPLTG